MCWKEKIQCQSVTNGLRKEHVLRPPFFGQGITSFFFFFIYWIYRQGIARTQSPTLKNCVPELPTFGAIAGFSLTGVQWKGLDLGRPPF